MKSADRTGLLALTNRHKIAAGAKSAARSRKHDDANRCILRKAGKSIIQGGDKFCVQSIQAVGTIHHQCGDAVLFRLKKDRAGLRRLRRVAHKVSKLVCPDFPGFFNLCD